MAKQVIRRVKHERRQPGRNDDFWLLATMGEAFLVLGEQREALDWYRRAVQQASDNMGDVASMSRQVALISQVSTVSAELLDVFDLGNIVVFAGHLIDHPNRLSNRRLKVRFPPDPKLEEAVRQAIRWKLDEMNARIGYCSVACGADILFAEELLKRERTTLHVVLPFVLKDFYKTSVDFGLEDDGYLKGWRERCDKIIDAATEVHYATNDLFLGDEVLFDYGNNFAQGLSIIRAGRIGIKPVALCLLDPSSSAGVGTSSFYANWRAGGRRSEVVDLAKLRDEVKPKSRWPKNRKSGKSADTDGFASREWQGRRIRRKCQAMLFADVKNFSMIREELAPEFFATFIDKVSSVVYGLPIKSVFRNTWGDGLFMVFNDVLDCAELALNLLETIEDVSWEKLGLPADTTVRIGVHYGPVYRQMDKIIRRYNYFGSHVNRAARIEPVTTPGCIFASEQFAAELALLGEHDYVTEYVGVEELAKDFDRCTLYQLARRE